MVLAGADVVVLVVVALEVVVVELPPQPTSTIEPTIMIARIRNSIFFIDFL